MPRFLVRLAAVLGLGTFSLSLVLCAAPGTAAQEMPPPPPTDIRNVPPPSTPSQPGRVLELKPGQKWVDPEEVRRAPTIHEYNSQLRPPEKRRIPPHPAIAPPRWPRNPDVRKTEPPAPAPPPVRPKPQLKVAADAAGKLSPSEQHLLKHYPVLATEITPEALSEHLGALARHESRAVGHSGERIAAEYVAGELRAIFGQVTEEPFSVSVPVDHGGGLQVAGERFSVRALWPTPARGQQVSPEGITASIAEVKSDGSTPPPGHILLVEAGVSPEQLASMARDARALLLVEPKPDEAAWLLRLRPENLPEQLPLFWISRADASRLRSVWLRAAAGDAVLTSDVRWETVQAKNFSAQIDGWDPLDVTDGGRRLSGLLRLDESQRDRLAAILREYSADGGAASVDARERAEAALGELLATEQRARWELVRAARDQTVVLHAGYDAFSAAPGLAPGADQAVSVAALLELARVFRLHPPLRPVRVVATSASYPDAQGLRTHVTAHVRSGSGPGRREAGASGGVALVALLLSGGVGWFVYRGGRGQRQVWIVAGVGAAIGIPLVLLSLRSMPAASPRTSATAANAPLVVTLDLSGAARQLQGSGREIEAPLLRAVDEHLRRVGVVWGWETASERTASVEARSPGANGAVRELRFTTVTPSPHRGWPHDTLAHVQVSNVTDQTRALVCVLDHLLNDPDQREAVVR